MSLTLTAAITQAAAQLGLLDSGEGLSAQQITDGLFDAKNMIDNWSSEGVMVLSEVVSTIPMVSGIEAYVLSPRPMKVVAASHEIQAYGAFGANPVAVLAMEQFYQIPDRESTSLFVKAIGYDRGFPNGSIYCSPRPYGGTMQLITYTPLTQFADATTPLVMLPGYERLIVLGLAIESASRYNMTPSETLVHNYEDALARVRNLNAEMEGPPPPAGQTGSATNPPTPLMPHEA
jgi:hypothetical protein